MLRPLSIVPNREESRDSSTYQYSPAHRHRQDSLVFSITSQKGHSPKDTILIDSKASQVNRELQTLQLKLEYLENKVQNITTDQGHNYEYRDYHNINNESSILYNTEKAVFKKGKENVDSHNRAGKIVKKDRDLSKTNRIVRMNRSKNKNQTFTQHSRNSLVSEDTQLFHKVKELSRLQKEVTVMKKSIERTERSKSLCSEKLSASKSLIRSLKKQQKKQDKLIHKLKADLKKSETIREKQKQIILKQQQQIAHYKEIAMFSRKLLR